MAADVGWEYTPAFGYSLTEILTKFGVAYDDHRTVTVEVYDGLPAVGGRLLRSAEFTPTNGVFSGALFIPLNLIAGHTYFIGFRNVSNLGVNTTGDPAAKALPPLYFSYNDDGSYSTIDTGQGANSTANPILEFYGGDNLTPAEEVEQLISEVVSEVGTSTADRGRNTRLTSILLQAKSAFSHHNPGVGTVLLRIFQRQVQLQIARKDSADAAWLVELAQEIIEDAGQRTKAICL